MFSKTNPHQTYSSMNQILPGTVFEGALWLGDIHSLSHKKQISDSKIKTAICCIHGYKPQNLPKDVTLYHFPLHDKEEQDIQQYFRNAYEIIRKGRENGSVLVFCFAGVSRSASIVLSYIMAEHNKDYRQAFQTVVNKRVICPNKGFERQLVEYEKQLFKTGVKKVKEQEKQVEIKKTKKLSHLGLPKTKSPLANNAIKRNFL